MAKAKTKRKQPRTRTYGAVTIHFRRHEDASQFVNLLLWAKRNCPDFPRDLMIQEGPSRECRYKRGQVVILGESKED